MTTTHNQTDTDPNNGLALLLGPRQADVMRYLWMHGPATAREIHGRLGVEHGLAYTTITTICARLVEKGALLRQSVADYTEQTRHHLAHVYTPRLSEEAFVAQEVEQRLDALLAHFPALVRTHVGQSTPDAVTPQADGGHSDRAAVEQLLAYLGALTDADGRRTQDTALDLVAALLERAEAAERQAAALEAMLRREQRTAHSAAARAAAAERKLAQQRAGARQAQARALLAEVRVATISHLALLQEVAAARGATEHFHPSGVCRICGQETPHAPGRRRDGLPGCADAACIQEAKRRDNAAKQRRFRERRRKRHVEHQTRPR